MGDVLIKQLIEIIERNPRATIFFSSSIYTFAQIIDELGDDVKTSSSFSKTIVMKNGCTVLITIGDSVNSSDTIIPIGIPSSMHIERFEEPFPFYAYTPNNQRSTVDEWNVEYHDKLEQDYEW